MEEVLDDLIDKVWKNDRVIELQKLAEENGWGFQHRERFSAQATAIKGFRIFKGKRGKRVIGICEMAVEESSMVIRTYDYIYYSDGGKQKTTITELHSPELDLSPFFIRPKGAMKRIFGRTPRDTAHPQFHKQYEVDATDADAAYMQLPGSALQKLAEGEKRWLEGKGSYMLLYAKKKQLSADQVMEAQQMALELADMMIHDHERWFV